MKLNQWQALIAVGLSITALASALDPEARDTVAAPAGVAREALDGRIQPTAAAPEVVSHAQPQKEDAGEMAYRAGRYKQASKDWLTELSELAGEPGNGARMGQLCYNLGNAAYRDGEGMQAIAWYTAARRHIPRDEDLLANLRFVRGELGLPPEDSSGLLATLGSSLRSWTPRESQNFAWIGVLLLAAAMGYEAMRGGARGRNGVFVALGLCALLWLPFLRHSMAGGSSPHMVIAARGTNGRSEPRPDAKTLAHLEPTEVADHLDEWQDWTQLRTHSGEVVWVASDKVMSIDW